MELINTGKLSVPKKYHNSVKSIELKDGEYTIKLNDGFEFEWKSKTAIDFSQKAVLSSLKAIVSVVSENADVEADVAENADVEAEFDIVDDKLKSQIVYDFLVLGHTVDEIEEKTHKNAGMILTELELLSVHRGNFIGLPNSRILNTLKFYYRNDLVKLFELLFYGLNNNIERIKIAV